MLLTVAFSLFVGRGNRCILAVPSLRLLGVPRAMEQKATGNGFSGMCSLRLRASPVPLSLTLHASTGDHHVPAVAANAGLDRPRDRDAAQRGVRPLLDVAQRPEPLCQMSVWREIGPVVRSCRVYSSGIYLGVQIHG